MGSDTVDLILGTAGHIDHGKSSLVQALTGVNPDRLAEEKKRGITIELGFARLDLPDGTSLGVVDVPGHERFVRQMIAGSTGIDLALLCIAADDGIMPQTEEHLAVLDLLGVPTCVVALTKIDLVDAEWAAFMADEIRSRLATTPYADAPIVKVSSRTGEGLDELKDTLAKVAHAAQRSKTGTTLRLPVDRSFSIKGAGTVVTGTLWSGTAAIGDEVEVLPSGLRTRIRSVQVHGEAVEYAEAGHRVALNLNALSTDEVRPGDFLVAPNTLRPTDRFDADVRYLGIPGTTKPLVSGTRVHIAHGTREVCGRVLFMNGKEDLKAGERAYAQIRLDEPLAVAWCDRFVLRSYSPVHVIGGGMVLRAHPKRTTTLTSETEALLDALAARDEPRIARTAFALMPLPATADELADVSGLSADAAAHELKALEHERTAVRLQAPTANGRDRWVAKQQVQKHRSTIENELLKFHANYPDRTGIAKEALHQRCFPRATEECFDALIAEAAAAGAVAVSGGEVSHPQAGAGARVREEQAAAQLYGLLTQNAGAPPAIEEVIATSGLDTKLAYRALGALEREGKTVRVGQTFSFESAALSTFEQAVRTRLAAGPATAAELRDALGTSRKYAIPLLEYFDACGITRREGDRRVLNE